MTGRRRPQSANPARRVKRPLPLDQAIATPPKRAASPLTEQFYVSVDGQLKSGYGTYQTAENAAQSIKRRYPVLQVSVYDVKEHRHTTIEQPTPAADLHKKSPNRVRNMTSQRRAVAGSRR